MLTLVEQAGGRIDQVLIAPTAQKKTANAASHGRACCYVRAKSPIWICLPLI